MGDTHEHYIFQFLYKFNLYNMEHPPCLSMMFLFLCQFKADFPASHV